MRPERVPSTGMMRIASFAGRSRMTRVCHSAFVKRVDLIHRPCSCALGGRIPDRSTTFLCLPDYRRSMIEIRDVSKSYGHFRALDDCTTSVTQGSVVVVCGPSGSGKSTLIRCVNGLERVDSGTIAVDGIVVTAPNTNLAKLRARIGMVFQSFELFPHRTVIDNLDLAQVEVLRRPRRGHRTIDASARARWARGSGGEVSVGVVRRAAAARGDRARAGDGPGCDVVQ